MNEVELALQVIKQDVEERFFPWVVESIVIENDEQLKNMSDLLTIGKAISNDADASLKAITDPIRAQEKEARDAFSPLISRIHIGWARIDDAIITYHRKKKTEADALILLQQQEQAQKIIEARETGEILEQEAIIARPVTNTIKGNMGTTSVQTVPEFFIINENDVPRELCSPDIKKIKAWYSLGNKQIPGVLITYKERTVSRFG